MSRIKLIAPDSYSFSCTIPVRITDVNYGGHVGNDALLGIIHEARLQFLQHHGFSEMNLGGAGLIMADVAIEYKNEGFYGDDLIVSVVANDFQRVSFDIFYKIEKDVKGKRILIALAKTGMVCYDYNLKKICPISQDALKLAGNLS
jgi:acyl-CoA thioester hydrolase